MSDDLIPKCLEVLCCPNDSAKLEYSSGKYLTCKNCGSKYPVYAPNVVEILPSLRHSVSQNTADEYEKDYSENYNKLFSEKFSFNPDSLAWGAIENITAKQAKRKEREINQILKKADLKNKIVCDISSGAGWMTLRSAAEASIVVNCDMSCSNLNYVYNKSDYKNILFVRADFFSPPFVSNVFDIVFCTDTLIYGNDMVKKLLLNIKDMIKMDGIAIVDFYNRMHRNPFHKPYMIGYSIGEVKMLLKELNISEYTYDRFCQESDGFLKGIIPATRHIISFRK